MIYQMIMLVDVCIKCKHRLIHMCYYDMQAWVNWKTECQGSDFGLNPGLSDIHVYVCILGGNL